MKQYTNESQTAKLIELGFEKPKGSHSYWRGNELVININYSIGELIEMLGSVSELEITRFGSGWGAYDELRAFSSEELIDALYAMVVKLKEKEVI